MKLTRASSYALHAVVYMAREKGTALVAAETIAKDQSIPEKFLPRLLKPLVSAQILLSRKGPGGGYRLARPSSLISMLEIIEAVDGPIQGLVPMNNGKAAARLDSRLQAICDQSAGQVRKLLGAIRISELTRR